jgi:hypothetical protein
LSLINLLEEQRMQILYINNDGGGFADYIEIDSDTTVQTLFDARVQGRPSDYLIRVNRQPTTASQVLREGDRVSFTPVKIEGARGTQHGMPARRAFSVSAAMILRY